MVWRLIPARQSFRLLVPAASVVPPQQLRQPGEVRRDAAGLVHSGHASVIIGAGRRGGVADAPNLWLALPWSQRFGNSHTPRSAAPEARPASELIA